MIVMSLADCTDDALIALLCQISKELRQRGIDVPSYMEVLPRMFYLIDMT